MLKSKRLVLKTPTLADAPNMAEYLNRKDTAHMMCHVPYPYSLADAHQFITRTRAVTDGKKYNGIYNHQDTFMGIVGIAPKPDGNELAYWLGHPFWGNGYMTEACSLIITQYFNKTSQNELYVSHFLINDKSKSVIQKLGFDYLGNVMLDDHARKTTHEAKRYRLTKQDWIAKNEN